jgi:hypothetical protein
VRGLERLPFVGALALLSAVLVLGIYLDLRWGSPLALYVSIAVVVGLGALYLWEYASRPMAAPSTVPGSAAGPGSSTTGAPDGTPPFLDPKDEEEFVDPVIEADQIASGEVVPETEEDASPVPGTDESPGAPP